MVETAIVGDLVADVTGVHDDEETIEKGGQFGWRNMDPLPEQTTN